jgi:hypothetical protein
MEQPDTETSRLRVLSLPLVRLAVYAGVALATIILGTVVTRLIVPPEPSPWNDLALLKNLILPIALFAIYAGLVRLLERRSATEVNLRKGALTLLVGILIGSAIIGSSLVVLRGLGMAEISGGTGLVGIERELLALMITTMLEELLFRVILFKILEEIAGSLFAIAISAAAFGLTHLGNPGATPIAIFALAMEMGVMVALAYMLTRNVWIAVGIHAGWNFTQGFVFGTLNSGQRHPSSYFQTTLSGPDLLDGGSFGLEGSVVTLGLCLIVSALLFVLVLHKRRWVGLRFRLESAQRRTDR